MNFLCANRSFAIGLLLVVCFCNSFSCAEHKPFTEVDSLIRNFMLDEARLWDSIQSHMNGSSTAYSERDRALEDVYKYFTDEFRTLRYGKVESVRQWNWNLAELIEEANSTQRTVLKLLTDKRQGLMEIVEQLNNRFPRLINQIFEETKKNSFLAFIRENSDYCQTIRLRAHSHVQNVVTDFYQTIVEALLKGYAISQMSLMLAAINGPLTKFYKNASTLRISFESHYKSLEYNVQEIVKNFSGEIWTCDDFSLEDSYTQITNFMQGYIENEVNFNREGSCARSCDDYQKARQHNCRNGTACQFNYLDRRKTRCEGAIRNCTFIESDMSLCTNVRRENDAVMSRKYNYVRYSSGQLLGRGQFCPEEIKLKSWIHWFVSCDFCFCYCDNRDLSDRYFSLREALSNIESNRVVTGIRLMKRDRIIHLFVTEHVLRPRGAVEENSKTSWQGDYRFVIDDFGVENDYHELTWEKRGIDLDIVRVPEDEVVTGVRFRVADGRLRFELRSTMYNFETGELYKDRIRSTWRGNNNRYKQRISVEHSDVPTRSPLSSVRLKGTGYYVEFTPTDIHKDAAQTTVPFIDTQPVEASPPRPLIGAGLYYKSMPGYGGYIAPIIVTDSRTYQTHN